MTAVNSYRFGPAPPSDPWGITWLHAGWASDLVGAVADGAPVSAWTNHTGGGDPANAGSARPTLEHRVTAYDLKPAVRFIASSSQYLMFDITNVAQPFSMVAFGNAGSSATVERLMGSGQALAAGIGDSGGNLWQAGFNTQLSGTASNLNPHLLRAYANGASSVLAVDGTTVATGNMGAAACPNLVLGAGMSTAPAFGNFLNGRLAFWGIAAGDVTTDPGWNAFKAFIRSYYHPPTPIA